MTTHSPEEMEKFYEIVDQTNLIPGWRRSMGVEWKPKPYLWRWTDLEPLALRAGELVTHSREVERRVLRLANPGLQGKMGTTPTMSAAVQLILPGEVAPAHRHSPTAIRWIIKGEGAYTAVNGDQCYMERGDLILTPAWTWHDHGHEGAEPMIWMDGLDWPVVRSLDAIFYEDYPEDRHPVVGVGNTRHRYAAGGLKPAWETHDQSWSPLYHFRWADTHQALHDLAQVGASPFDDVAMEFTNPNTGGPVLATMSCWVQMIRPGVRTKAHRQTNSAVYHVHEGQGYSVVDGQRFDWTKGDFFVVPSWCWHEHATEGDEPAILFSIQDTPIMQSSGLYMEEAYTENGGHQEVTSHF